VVGAAVAMGALAFAMSGPAAAEPPPVSTMDYWYVAEVFPHTAWGWYQCDEAAPRYYKGHCKVDSDNTSLLNLWASRG
jgi:hypothetical protein